MPSPTKKSVAPVATQTQTSTATSTKTKVIALTVGFLALGLAAYGFGFVPGLDMDKEQAFQMPWQQDTPQPQEMSGDVAADITPFEACRQRCVQSQAECLSSLEAVEASCTLAYSQCKAECSRLAAAEDAPPSPPAVPSCSLTAENIRDFRQPTTLVANEDWQPITEYRLTAAGDDVLVQQLVLQSIHNTAAFSEVGIFQGTSTLLATGRFPSGSGIATIIPLPRELRLPAGREVRIQVSVRLAPVQPYSTTPAGTANVARSGNWIHLDMGESSLPTYQLEARCATSDMPVYAPALPDTHGQRFMVRKSKPVLLQLPLITTTFASGTQQDLYRFHAQPDRAGDIAIKKLSWNYRYVADYRASLNNFRLFRGSTEVASTSYRIVNTAGDNLYIDSLTSRDMPTGQLTLIFENEETVSGSGNIYSLRATPRGHVPGDVFTLTPPLDTLRLYPTGYLTSPGAVGAMDGIAGPNIDESEPADGAPEAASGFVWSDLSEIPHSSMVGGRAGGSRDWIAGFVEYPLQGQTLSR
ncbi:hypothetical protein KBD61_05210 [Patescibacteria group bacterium]|nr:hypothetical protein [Patescibacteria group bacterium]